MGGAVHDRLLTRGAGGGVGFAKRQRGRAKASQTVEEGIMSSSRAARREAQRQAGIPTSQQPIEQGGHGEYRWYRYKDSEGYDAAVVHHPADSHHPYPHWEAGRIKKDDGGQIRRNIYGAPRIESGKKKVPYRR